jgi:hypothetical protein
MTEAERLTDAFRRQLWERHPCRGHQWPPLRSAATDPKRHDPTQIYGCIANATAFQARMLPVTLLRDGNAPRNGVPYGKAMLPPRQMYALSHRSTNKIRN